MIWVSTSKLTVPCLGARTPTRCRGLILYDGIRVALDDDRAAEIAATFERIRRPLQWPMENFRRQRISNRRFVVFRFSRVRRAARAGFAFGFALSEDSLPAVREPPEVVAYAFVHPAAAALHRTLVAGAGPWGSDRHRLYDRGASRLDVHGVRLDRRRHEREVRSFSGLLELGEDRPQPFQPRHVTGPESERLSLAHAASVPQRVATS